MRNIDYPRIFGADGKHPAGIRYWCFYAPADSGPALAVRAFYKGAIDKLLMKGKRPAAGVKK